MANPKNRGKNSNLRVFLTILLVVAAISVMIKLNRNFNFSVTVPLTFENLGDDQILKSASTDQVKVKGKAKIPDYIQIRDENFVLVAYFRADRPMKNIEKFGLEGKEEELAALIEQLPFGKLQKLEL